MLKNRAVEMIDLTARLQQIEEMLDEPSAVSRRVVPCGGRMFVLGTMDEPRFRSATWLRAPRRSAV